MGRLSGAERRKRKRTRARRKARGMRRIKRSRWVVEILVGDEPWS